MKYLCGVKGIFEYKVPEPKPILHVNFYKLEIGSNSIIKDLFLFQLFDLIYLDFLLKC